MAQQTGISIRPSKVEPLYQQIFDKIVSRIRSGTYPAGYRLPPSRTLAEELSVHRNTVVRVYDDLEHSGFVESHVGRGTFVVALPPQIPQGDPKALAPLPWSTLTSTGLSSEVLRRAERLSRTHVSPSAISLGHMQPSVDLIPTELLSRCFEHVLHTHSEKAFLYSPREGLPRLRSIVAEDLRRQGVPASDDLLIITTGSQQGLDLIARALVNPGDTFLVDEATYAGALNLLSMAGARVVGIPTDDDGPDMAVLDRHVASGAKGFYVMPHCQNPTGVRISMQRRQALVEWSHRAQIPLIEDDYASELTLDDVPAIAPIRALDGEVIYLGTYSKKLSPGLRIGYLLVPKALYPRLTTLKHAIDLGTSPLLQLALAEFLERGYLRPHLRATCVEYCRRRDALDGALRKALPSNVKWRLPQTGVQIWLPLPNQIDPEALFLQAQQEGVSVNPGTINVVHSIDKPGLRLTFCAEPPDRLAEGARRLGRAFASLARRDIHDESHNNSQFDTV